MATAEERDQSLSEDGRVKSQWGRVACRAFLPAIYSAGAETLSEMPVASRGPGT